jgi:hypothetical protein
MEDIINLKYNIFHEHEYENYVFRNGSHVVWNRSTGVSEEPAALTLYKYSEGKRETRVNPFCRPGDIFLVTYQ